MNLYDYWRIIKNRKQIIILAFITTVLTTLVASMLWPPKYEGIATIMLDYDSGNPMNIGVPTTGALPPSAEYINTQIALIQSRRIAEDVASMLNLDKAPKIIADFNEAKAGSSIFFWKKPMKMDIKTWLADELLLNHLKVDAVRDSRFVAIKYYSPEAEFSAAVANAFAKAYTDYNLELKVTPFKDAEKWFSEKLKDVKGESDKAAEELRKYQQGKGIIGSSSSQGGIYDDTVQRLDQINRELATAKTKQYETKVALSRVERSKGEYDSLPEVIANSFIQSLKADKIKIETQITELSAKVGTKHPQYVRLNSELQTVKAKLSAEMSNIVNAIRQDQASANQRVNSLEIAVMGLKKEAAKANLSRYEMDSINRESEAYKQIYEGILKKYNETSLQGDINKTNVFLVDAAVPPTKKYSPKIILNLILAMFIGFFLGLGLAFFFEYLDDTIKDAGIIEKQYGVTVLGTIPVTERELAWTSRK